MTDPTPAATRPSLRFERAGGTRVLYVVDESSWPTIRRKALLCADDMVASHVTRALTTYDTLVAALEAVARGSISYGSGPGAPCVDHADYEIERHRDSWTVVSSKAMEQVRAALALVREEGEHD